MCIAPPAPMPPGTRSKNPQSDKDGADSERGHTSAASDRLSPTTRLYPGRTILQVRSVIAHPNPSSPIGSVLRAPLNLTTILTTNGRTLDELDGTSTNSTRWLTCGNAPMRITANPVSKFGNRVWRKSPWVQIPPSPLDGAGHGNRVVGP